MTEPPQPIISSAEDAAVYDVLCRTFGLRAPPWTPFESDLIHYDRAEYDQLKAELAALDPGAVQLVLDTFGHGKDGLEWQLDLSLPSGPHPSVLRVHDRGVTAWYDQYWKIDWDGEVDWLLAWVWAPDERTARQTLEEALRRRDPGALQYLESVQVHLGNVLPAALHPRRVPYLDRQLYGKWIAMLERAQYAGLDGDDTVVAFQLP
ncbi:hypothetical protein [Deinococcus ficus]|uniref:Uncharacterized protein n=1 Tax=Deinococcus ficus TaxID=317577 RepID=A0A221T3D3_9DEIO|nr:hypothetical protein [Deinococcus ficus]ASN83414.1 hypothetical protein DFI_19650 [Deinococcus ficus]